MFVDGLKKTGKRRNPSVASLLFSYNTPPAPAAVPACCELSPELPSPSPRQDAVSTSLYGYLGNALAHKLSMPNDMMKTCNADLRAECLYK